MLAWLAGEFAEPAEKTRIWKAADEQFEPTWDRDNGEFTFGFGLDETYPRGQLNARAMAGWVCGPGAWTKVFDEPDLAKFDHPTVVDVDFPRVAMSEARWDGEALHVAAHPQTASIAGTRTALRVTNVSEPDRWAMTRPDGETVALDTRDGDLVVELVVDNQSVRIHRI